MGNTGALSGRVCDSYCVQKYLNVRLLGTDRRHTTMSNQPHLAQPRTGDAIDDKGCGDDREAEVTAVSHTREARCLRNKLFLANAAVWIVILVLLKVFLG
jgi:hypothetical protein